jgi:uncharacterized protein (TIGR02453 family)
MTFSGFTPDSLNFLADLAKHNDREWFAQNRDRYERELLGPEREFVAAAGAALQQMDSRVQAVPAIDKSIFRINRDTRFSRDKSPYKTYSDLWFWLGPDRKHSAGYFVRLEPGALLVGGGAHMLTDAQLGRYREAVVAARPGEELVAILDELTARGYEIGESTRKRVPAGFATDHPRADLLKFSAVHAVMNIAPPAEMTGPKFVEWCMTYFADTKPLIDWLAEHLGGAEIDV